MDKTVLTLGWLVLVQSMFVMGDLADLAALLRVKKPVEFLDSSQPVSTRTVIPTEKKGCGWRQETITSRITTRTDALFGEFPWVVAVFKYNDTSEEYQYHCVGSLIHPKVVLTVGHHFLKPARIRIRAGDWDMSQDYEIRPHQSSDVKTVVRHADYSQRLQANDVALLILKTAINKAPNIGFACLPPHASTTPAGSKCITTGWGFDKYTNGSLQNVLKMVAVPTVEHSDCEARFNGILTKKLVLHHSTMCAGGEKGKDACLKDGGAPLMCPYQDVKDRFYQAGIVAFGVGCGIEGIPGGYSDVSYLRNWIDQNVRAMGYTTDTYTP